VAKNKAELLTVREVARQLRVDDTTVRRWIKMACLMRSHCPIVACARHIVSAGTRAIRASPLPHTTDDDEDEES